MHISPTYAARDDLRPFEKWRFTVEEHIAENRGVRALYRTAVSWPGWLKEALQFGSFLAALPAFCLLGMCTWVAEDILGNDASSDAVGVFSLLLMWMIYGILVWLVPPVGLTLIILALPFFLMIWLYSVMSDYGQELQTSLK